MESRATAPYVRIAPRKVQLVLDLIRNKPAEHNFDMDTTRLYVAEATVSQGPTLKRIRPRAHGRAFRINKKTSHINLVLKEAE